MLNSGLIANKSQACVVYILVFCALVFPVSEMHLWDWTIRGLFFLNCYHMLDSVLGN